MGSKEPTRLHTFVSLLFWGFLTYCSLFYIPKQFKWYYNWDFILDTAPMIKWSLVFLPFIIWNIRSIIRSKKNKELKKA